MNLLNEFSGTIHAIERRHIGEVKGPLLVGKQYYITKCHWADDCMEWGRYQIGEETEKPVTCKNCLKRLNHGKDY